MRVFGQERSNGIAFEVASVRPAKSDSTAMSVSATPGRFSATNIDLRNLITVAYRVPWFRIVNAPTWSERYDVAATMPTGTDAAQLGAMLQSLLTERFKMQAHMETREQPVYALVTAGDDNRYGPQLQRSKFDCAVVMAAPTNPVARAPASDYCEGQIRGRGHVVIRGMPLDALANYLSGAVEDRVVVNRTGLGGTFDLELRFEPTNSGSARSSGEFPTLVTAIREQLGLKLEAQRGPVEVLVIDSIERPSPN
jgi:uncharacterized protein (TIGR03435 family)